MATFTYLAGHPRPTRDPGSAGRDVFERWTEHLLDQGSFALRQLRREAAGGSQRVRLLIDAGYLRPGPDGELGVSPAGLFSCEDRLLAELFRATGGGGGWHDGAGQGAGAVPGDGLRSLAPGEPVEHVQLHATLANALTRGRPLSLREEDVVVRPGEASGRCATVILLDLSGSMARHGKFPAARRAALALRALVRRRYPGDELLVAGFATRATPLTGQALLEALPRNVGLFDPHQNGIRLPSDAPEVPEHFTNIQAGLRLARRHLATRSHAAKQVLLITDGEPTAHLEGGDVVLCYPPTEATRRHTLAEARRTSAAGIALSVFALIGAFSDPGLERFVENLARAGRGRAVCCPARQLGRHLLERFTRTRTTW